MVVSFRSGNIGAEWEGGFASRRVSCSERFQAEAEARQLERLRGEGVALSTDELLTSERRRAEERVSAAQAKGLAELRSAEAQPQVEEGEGGGGEGGSDVPGLFHLKLPEPNIPAAARAKGPWDEIAKKFVSPVEDILAYAGMIGMDVVEDMDLLWIADEALQASEPEGWELRQDPRGNTYYANTTTNVVMLQHPVDYHYQQFYLQLKMQKKHQAS